MGAGADRARPKSGPIRLRVNRLHREARQSGLSELEEVRWLLVMALADAVDDARAERDHRTVMSAGAKLEAALVAMTAREPGPGDGGGAGETGNGDLYGRPPTVGDASDA